MISCPNSYQRVPGQEGEIHIHSGARTALVVPRFETRYMEDSLAHRGSVLWSLVSFKEHDISYLSKNGLYQRIRTRDYVKQFKFDTVTASSAHRRYSDFLCK